MYGNLQKLHTSLLLIKYELRCQPGNGSMYCKSSDQRVLEMGEHLNARRLGATALGYGKQSVAGSQPCSATESFT